jgi:hypothetical protein
VFTRSNFWKGRVSRSRASPPHHQHNMKYLYPLFSTAIVACSNRLRRVVPLGREPGQALAQPLVHHLGAPPELEGGERSKAAHCSHTLVCQRVKAVALEVQRASAAPHQRPSLRRWPQQQPHRQRVVPALPPTATQPHRRRSLAPNLRPEAPSSAACSTSSSTSSGSSAHPLSMLPLRRHVRPLRCASPTRKP